MKNILTACIVIVILIHSVLFAQSHCDPKLEAKAEAEIKACSTKKLKSTKLWKDIDSAKKSIEIAIAKKNVSSLYPYIGCDAGDSSRLDVICESELPKINIDALNKIIDRSKGRHTLEKSKWITYGISKDIFLLCSTDYAFVAAKNYCEEQEKAQPVIEIRKSAAGFYIFGVPLSGR